MQRKMSFNKTSLSYTVRQFLRHRSTTVQSSQKPFDPCDRPKATVSRKVQSIIDKGFNLPSAKLKVTTPPEHVTDSIHYLMQNDLVDLKAHLESYVSAGQALFNFYVNRSLPFQGTLGSLTKRQIEEISYHRYSQELDEAAQNFQRRESVMDKIDTEVKKEIHKRSQRWKSVEYDKEAAWSYLLGGKAAYDYACLKSILNEIKTRDNQFKPKTLLDFGSGVGTVSWAVNEHFGGLYEIFSVDKSRDMNDLYRMVINRSKDAFDLPSGYSYRFQLPRDATTKYDLVTSSFTLLDFSNESERMAYVQTLWDRVEPNGYLVLTEVGTKSGFQTMLEARDVLIHLFKDTPGYIFAPCPHDKVCPREIQQKQPCYFVIRYRNFPFKWFSNKLNDTIFNGRFSYIVAKKSEEGQNQRPRVVEQPLRRHNHVICRMCTKNGHLEEIVGVKRDKHLYKYLKSLKVGQKVDLTLEK